METQTEPVSVRVDAATDPVVVSLPPSATLSLIEAIRRMAFDIPPPPPQTADVITQTDASRMTDFSGQTDATRTADFSSQAVPRRSDGSAQTLLPPRTTEFATQTYTYATEQPVIREIVSQPPPLPTLESIVREMPSPEVREAYTETELVYVADTYSDAGTSDTEAGTPPDTDDEGDAEPQSPEAVSGMNVIAITFARFPDLAQREISPLNLRGLPIPEYRFGANGALVTQSTQSDIAVIDWPRTARLISSICLIRTGFQDSEDYVDWTPLGVHPLMYTGQPDQFVILGKEGLPWSTFSEREVSLNWYDWITMAQSLFAIHAAHFDGQRTRADSAPLEHEAEVIEELRHEFEVATPEPVTSPEPESEPATPAVEEPMQQSELGYRAATDENTRLRMRRRLLAEYSPPAPTVAPRPTRVRPRETDDGDEADHEMDDGVQRAEEIRRRREERLQRQRVPGVNQGDHSDRIQALNRKHVLAILKQYNDEITEGRLLVRPMLWSNDLESDGEPATGFQIKLHRDRQRLVIVKTRTGHDNPSMHNKVNWHSTLLALLEGLRAKDITIDRRLLRRVEGKTKTADPTRFVGSDRPTILDTNEGVRSKRTGLRPRESRPGLSLPQSTAKAFLETFFARVGTDVPTFQLNAVIPGVETDYHLTRHNRQLRLRQNGGQRRLAPAGADTSPTNKVDWSATLGALADIAAGFRDEDTTAMTDDRKRQIENFLKVMWDTARRFDIQHIKEVVPRSLNRSTGGRLRGRGLRGAGQRGRPRGSGGAPYSSVTRKGKYYNLNDIQDSGLASAYIYKKLGSKYVRIPDLNNGVLNVCYPSRKKVWPKHEISEPVKQMVKDLVYKQSISQDEYDKLSVDDQQLFKEILQVTHIEHAFRDELPDPLATLKMEYDKLKGEVLMGNDNPSILKQLKVVTVDMYSNRLISDKEFKQIITRLI